MHNFVIILIQACHLAGALRKKAQTKQKQLSPLCPHPQPGCGDVGKPGQVDFLYSFGSPGAGSPGLQHQTNADGIFPGLRTWRVEEEWADIVPVVTSVVWLWHPLMAAESIEVQGTPIHFNASQETTMLPSQLKSLIYLHYQSGYVQATLHRGCKRWNDFTIFSNYFSYEKDTVELTRMASKHGWNLAGSAAHDGDTGLIGGAQVSHLLQHEETLECVLTFQGTQTRRDWYANIAFRPTHFCGMTEEDETCGFFGFDTCKVRKPRGSFIHYGFADTLRSMVKEPQWQETIRANLPKCSAVYVTGHSLGGAMGSLFSACTSSNLKPGDFGYDEDYGLMAWTKGEPDLITKFSIR